MAFEKIDYKKHMTNGDVIRNVSNEELARFICGRTQCRKCDGDPYCELKDGPANGVLKWLNLENTGGTV